MRGKILRRCSVCGKFHASYLVLDHEGGKGYYCSSCWHALRAPKAADEAPKATQAESDGAPKQPLR